MVSVRVVICTAAAAVFSSAAYAADMPAPVYQPQPQPQIVYQAAPVETSNWYLRGDIGIGITSQADFLYLKNPLNAPVDIVAQHASMADTFFINGGIGYEWNNWLRFDVTAEYRAKTAVNAFIMYGCGGGCVLGDQYQAYLQTELLMANAYVDLGTWECLTPFVGFGIGGAYNTFSNLTDLGVGTSGNGVGRNSTDVNFAWALYAGLAYNVTQNFAMEFTYRYLNYGSVTDTIDCLGGCNPDSYRLQNLTSQDFMIGMRWRFQSEPRPALVQPVYQQPMYQQPMMQQPLMQPAPAISTRG